MDMIANLSLVMKKNLQKLDSVYRGPLRRSLVLLERSFLVLKKKVEYQSVQRIIRIVPRDLRNIVFVAFHSNPIGGHYGLHQTVVRLQLRFFWPKLYTYCKKMISSCVWMKACQCQD